MGYDYGMNSTKVIFISLATTLSALFLINNPVVFLVISWFLAGWYAQDLFKRGSDWGAFRGILFVAGYSGLLAAIAMAREEIWSDINKLAGATAKGKRIKFQSPITLEDIPF